LEPIKRNRFGYQKQKKYKTKQTTAGRAGMILTVDLFFPSKKKKNINSFDEYDIIIIDGDPINLS